MKAVKVAAAAAALVGGASAHRSHRNAHQALFEKRGYAEGETCIPGCTTIWKTITGEATLHTPAPPPPPPKPTATVWPTGPAVVPTPIPQVCPTPGTYTFPATTVVVTETTTVCAASTTELPKGTHTLGGVTTVVETATTVVCPYATQSTKGGVVTNVIETTTYVCPSAGTYTIAPITTTVSVPVTTVVIPVVTTVCPGTYTAPAVVTVVETATVVYCPFESAKPTLPAPAPPKETIPAPPKTPATPPKAPTGGLGGAGGKWAMTYTPYRPDSGCKTASEVLADCKSIAQAGFTTLRVYSTDCDTLTSVGAAARELGLNMIIGIFIGKPGCDNGDPDVDEQIADIKKWAQWDLVKLVVVGNEALFNNYCTVDQLKDLIHRCKSEFGGAGYSGPFTTTDVVSAWLTHDVSPICDAIDVVACNAHAYFNAQTLPSQAGTFVAGQLDLVVKKCGGSKPGYVMETGWPTAGNCNGVACAGVKEQAEAINSIKEVIGDHAVFFSATDDPWKAPGSCNCEQHWGCGQLFQ